MQKLSKLMLVAVAAIALATPAMAWDFSASGSVSSQFNMKTDKVSSAVEATAPKTFASSSGGISLKSAHTDGDKSLTFTYKLDVDTDGTAGTSAGLDETLSLAASDKLGGWTATATATQHKLVDGENGATGTQGDAITADPSAAITLVSGDGKMTYVLGSATHLARPNKASAVGAVGGLQDAIMNGDSHNGFSVGIAVSDTLSITPAIDMNRSAQCFGGTAQPGTSTTATQATCMGVNVAGSAGTVFGFSASFGSGSSSDDNGTQGSTGSSSVMGVALSFTFGTSVIAVDIAGETVTGKATSSSTVTQKSVGSETEFSYVLTLDEDSSITINVSNDSNEATTTATADKPTTQAGLELGYKTTVGPVTLEAGYGSNTTSDADDSGSAGTGGNGESDSDIGVKMSWSF
jgi:hypothetical protein